MEGTRNKIVVLGAGSYGTAIAHIATHCKNNDVVLYARSQKVCDSINKDHVNPKRFTKYKISDRIRACSDLKEAVKGAKLIVHCVPANFTTDFFTKNLELFPKGVYYVSTCKGIIAKTHQFINEAIEEILKREDREDIIMGYLSGPSFAKEMIKNHPISVVVASHKVEDAQAIQHLLSSNKFRIYSSDDVTGVEVGGAIKNPIAIGAGIIQGLGFGMSSIAAMVVEGSREQRLVCKALGGKPETCVGMSGIGDLMLTSFSPLSRNFRCGKWIAEGKTIEQICEKMGEVIEGITTSQDIIRLARKNKLTLPLFETIAAILRGEIKPRDGMVKLMERPPEHELFLD